MSQVAMLFGRHTAVAADDLRIARFEPLSTEAWPGMRAAVVLAQGCPWTCTYCHAPALQNTHAHGAIAWRDVRTHLAASTATLDAVVFSGGEPTRQRELIPAMQEARGMGFKVGLLTAGAYPVALGDALGYADWVALDIKAMPEAYQDITGKKASGAAAWESLESAIAWGGALEVRFTVDPTSHTREAALSVIRRVIAMGGPMPVIQQALPEGTTAEFRHALGARQAEGLLTADDLAEFAAAV